jgi:hypothetical protein
MTVANATNLTKGNKVLATDIIAISIALVSATGLLIHSARLNARLEKENRYLRNKVREMRKQMDTMVERPF